MPTCSPGPARRQGTASLVALGVLCDIEPSSAVQPNTTRLSASELGLLPPSGPASFLRTTWLHSRFRFAGPLAVSCFRYYLAVSFTFWGGIWSAFYNAANGHRYKAVQLVCGRAPGRPGGGAGGGARGCRSSSARATGFVRLVTTVQYRAFLPHALRSRVGESYTDR